MTRTALPAVVIPAYNEAATIRDVAQRALREAELVIVVDDGSTDGTAAALAGLEVVLLRNEANSGKAASLRARVRMIPVGPVAATLSAGLPKGCPSGRLNDLAGTGQSAALRAAAWEGPRGSLTAAYGRENTCSPPR